MNYLQGDRTVVKTNSAKAFAASSGTGRQRALQPTDWSLFKWRTISSSPPNPSPKAIPTRSPTRSPTRCSTRSSRRTRARRVAAETLCNTGLVVLAGEITTNAHVDYIQVARDTIKRIGYDNTELRHRLQGLRGAGLLRQAVATTSRRASTTRSDDHLEHGRRRPGPDVRLRLRRDARADAGADLLRAPPGRAPGAAAQGRPPAVAAPRRQAQVTMRYVDGKPHAIDTVVLSTQHHPSMNEQAEGARRGGDRGDHQAGAAEGMAEGHASYLVNPTGRFVIGGPQGDCGLTGRKIIVDTYGGACAARRRRVLGQGSVEGRPLGRLRGALRRQEHRRRRPRAPVPGAGRLRDRRRQADERDGLHRRHRQDLRRQDRRSWCSEHFDLRPKGIIQMLDLLRPIYEKTAAYGHFGRDEPEFTWEATDKAAALRAAAGISRLRDAIRPAAAAFAAPPGRPASSGSGRPGRMRRRRAHPCRSSR